MTKNNNDRRISESRRSNPDFFIHVPANQKETNQQPQVVPTPNGTFIATWTTAFWENAPNQKVMLSRSTDCGKTWSVPYEIDGSPDVHLGDDSSRKNVKFTGRREQAQYSTLYIVPHTGRIYIFYNKNIGITDIKEDITGILRFKYSDDDGLSWSEPYSLPIRRTKMDNQNPDVPVNWVCCTMITMTNQGDVMMSFERWASLEVTPIKELHLLKAHSSVWFLRFDNILTETDPEKLKVTTLPQGQEGIMVPMADQPSISIAQAPSLQSLSDGRLIATMRTCTGYIYYAISNDAGQTWSKAQPLRFVENGPKIENPVVTCPLFKLRDGRFVLFFYNNDGTKSIADPDYTPRGHWDSRTTRVPLYISIGREVPFAKGQPIVFNKPRIFAANDFVPYGGNECFEIGTSPSLFEYSGKYYFFYPDRKHFILGKIIDPEFLNDYGLPY